MISRQPSKYANIAGSYIEPRIERRSAVSKSSALTLVTISWALDNVFPRIYFIIYESQINGKIKNINPRVRAMAQLGGSLLCIWPTQDPPSHIP